MEDNLDSKLLLHSFFQLQKTRSILRLINDEENLILNLLEYILDTISTKLSDHSTKLYAFNLLKEILLRYGIPLVLILNDKMNTISLEEANGWGYSKEVMNILKYCIELFSFDQERLAVKKLADLYLSIEGKDSEYPCAEFEESEFSIIYKDCLTMLNNCQSTDIFDFGKKKVLKDEIKILLENIDFEDTAFSFLERLVLKKIQSQLLYHLNLLNNQIEKSKKKTESKKIQNELKLEKQIFSQSHFEPRFRTFFLEGETLNLDEGENNEFKQYYYPWDETRTKVLRRTICSFLNRRGGRIYIGINDSREVKGIILTYKERDSLKLNVYEIIREFEPGVANQELIKTIFIPILEYDNHTVIPGKFIVKIIIKQGDPGKIYSVSREIAECYIRNDGQSVKLKTSEIFDLIISRKEKPLALLPETEFIDPDPEEIIDIIKFKRNSEESKFEKSSISNISNHTKKKIDSVCVYWKIPQGLTDEEFEELIGVAWPERVLSARMFKNREGLSNGNSFIDFENKTDAIAFIQEFDARKIGNFVFRAELKRQ